MAEPKQFYGRYHRVNTQVWTDPAFASLPQVPPSARYLYFWLLAGQEATNLPGVVIAGPMAVAEILDWDVDATKATLQALVDAGLVLMDVKARLIYVRRSLADNPPANPNVITSWETSWSEIAQGGLKDLIWAEFEAHAKARGEEFLKSFKAACPRGNGSVNGTGNGSWNGYSDGSGNGSRNKNQNQPLSQSTKQSPEQNNGLGPGVVRSGFTSGEGDRDTTDLGQKPGADSGGDPGCGPGRGPGDILGREPLSGLGATSDPVAGITNDYGPRDDRTIDEVFADMESAASEPMASAPPVAEGGMIHAQAQAILDDWNVRVATPGSVFEPVTGQEAVKLAPAIMEALKDVEALTDLNDLFQIIPKDNFYSGDNDTKFVAFLRHYIAMSPEKRHRNADIARTKLRKLKGKSGSKSMPRSEAEAQQARAQQQDGPPPARKGNNLQSIVRSK